MTGVTRQFSVVGGQDELSLKIAFATDNGSTVNQHFGTAKSFAVYGINPDSFRLITIAEFEGYDADSADDKLAAKLAFLDGCLAVYCRACGASAVRQLLDRHIQPLKVSDESSIDELIRAFQRELNEGPSSWLAKAIMRQHGISMQSFENTWNE